MSEHKTEEDSTDESNNNGNQRNEKGQFTKGNTEGQGNKGSLSIVSALKKKLEEIDESDKDKRTYLQQIIQVILDKGITDKDVTMLKDIINRVDGLPKETIEQTVILPKPIMQLPDVHRNNGNKENSETNEED